MGRMTRALRKKLSGLPECPGVYLIRDAAGQVIYVGKSRCLRQRVSSYFTGRTDLKGLLIAGQAADVDVVPVATEPEALLLENRLIKAHQPKYNVNLRDGKSYPLVKITTEEFPVLSIVREERQDAARYFGPFTDAQALRRLVAALTRIYPVRQCAWRPGRMRPRPCFRYSIGRCAGPCAGKVSREEYRRIVRGLISLFQGGRTRLIAGLRRRMRQAAGALAFEEAQKMKEQLLLLETLGRELASRPEEVLVAETGNRTSHELSRILSLKRIPWLIEGYDIANLGPALAVGAQVSFRGGVPWKDGYRRYRIRRTQGQNDCAMIAELLTRRFDSEQERKQLPDLILVDGGKGQLGAAVAALGAAGIDVPVVALAKEREEIFLPGRTSPLRLPARSASLQLLQRVRDEAHRFSHTYHVALRRKRAVASFLDSVSGIGAVRKRRILQRFRDIRQIASASPDSLSALGLPEETARQVIAAARTAEHAHAQIR